MPYFKKFIPILFLILPYQIIFSQEIPTFFDNVEPDTSKLILHIDNTNFFKNNEYFNPFINGYTLIGYFLQPKLIYNYNSKFSMSGGIYLQKYSGIKKFSEIQPIFSVKYQATKHFKIIFGTLDGDIYNKLGDIIYHQEMFLTNNVQDGLHLRYSTKKLTAETWINWRQFIFQGSSYPEKFLWIAVEKYHITNKNDKKIIQLKLITTASHVGGQIDSSTVAVNTVLNNIVGINFNLYLKNKICKQIIISTDYYSSKDDTAEKEFGYGILSGASFINRYINLNLKYWYGNFFTSNYGNRIFQSKSQIQANYTEEQRNLLLMNVFYNNQNMKNIKIGVGANLYYDLTNSILDYSYSFYIRTNLDFILLR